MKSIKYDPTDIILVKAPVLNMSKLEQQAYFRSIRSSMRKLGNKVVIVPMKTLGELEITFLSSV